jgi:hypothetical protein
MLGDNLLGPINVEDPRAQAESLLVPGVGLLVLCCFVSISFGGLSFHRMVS